MAAPQTEQIQSPPPREIGLAGPVHRLFVYGTLQHPPLLQQLLGRVPALEPATVHGWQAVRLRDRVYPGLVPVPGQAARGHLIEVADDELEVLDRFEGAQYERIAVIAGDQQVLAWRLRDEHVHLGMDQDWDLARFVAEDATVFLGGSRPGAEHPWEP